MDMGLIVARIVHVLGGVFWVGAMVFVAAFLLPAVREAGPDGGKVMAGVARRHFLVIVPVVAALSILSGLWLYWHVSAGFSPAYMRSGPGMAYGIGAAVTILVFIIGLAMVRPVMEKSMALSQSAMSAEGREREALLGQAQSLRARGERMSRLVAALLVIVALAMAVGRYL
jgi:uncharacterized membrane protein